MNTVREYKSKIENEIRKWPGASVTYKRTTRHIAVFYSYKGNTARTHIPTSGSDRLGPTKAVSDARRLLKSLGASHIRASNDN